MRLGAPGTQELSDETEVDWSGGWASERAHQLADIALSGDEDNAECAASDLAREFNGGTKVDNSFPGNEGRIGDSSTNAAFES